MVKFNDRDPQPWQERFVGDVTPAHAVLPYTSELIVSGPQRAWEPFLGGDFVTTEQFDADPAAPTTGA